ncbi:MAG TPA: BTAD domain-containing putative transcriptional regulator [Anaerolineae bacterium]|nr:BTAD domain-containing putative transcriptional regulator [Anaerolineae bacterium]HMR65956.1 BTAD domain-containing putative transcriptional regulator [Anaerolineae bacterium]
MARLSLSLLGPFQATLAGEPITGFESNKVRALLTYLAVESDRPHARETLAGLFWPEIPEQTARANLRHVLTNLRRNLGDGSSHHPFLLTSRHTIQFNPRSDFWLDVSHFSRVIDAADRAGLASIQQLAEVVNLFKGQFLDGFSLKDSAAFEEWLLLRRERLQRQAVSAYQRLADHYQRQGDYNAARLLVRRQLELAPWREPAHRQLMQLLALSGQRGAALAQYEVCRRSLAEELNVEPEAETTGLYERIRSGALGQKAEEQRPEETAAPQPLLLIPAAPPHPTFVGRKQPLARLNEWLDLSLSGMGQVAFVTGEAGSGKTTLLHEFARRAQERHSDLMVARGSGNAHTGIGDPYLPFCQILRLLTGAMESGWDQSAVNTVNAWRLQRLLPVAGAALVSHGPDLIDTLLPSGPLLARATAYAGHEGWPEQLKALIARKQAVVGLPPPPQRALLEQYSQVLTAIVRVRPLILILDDLQWLDSSSVNLLFHLGRQLNGVRMLIVGAYRPEEIALGRDGERHPLESVLNEFRLNGGDISLSLEPDNNQAFMAALLDSHPNRLGEDFRQQLYQLSRGHPLFTLELLRDMRDRGDLVQDETGHWVERRAPVWTSLPVRIEAAIGERLGRLAPELRTIFQIASIEGETFTAEVVARISQTEPHQLIRQLSGVLDQQHHLVKSLGSRRMGPHRLSRYQFRHSLFQAYLYHSLSEAERSYLHEQVGYELERLYAEQSPEIAGELARHFEAAHLPERAITYRRQAGDQAVWLSAHEVAIKHYRRGLALLEQLPDKPERIHLALGLQLGVYTPLMVTKGFAAAEVVQIFAQTQTLTQQLLENLVDTPELLPALHSIWNVYFAQGNYRTARDWAQKLLDYSRNSQQVHAQAMANLLFGLTTIFLGKFTESLVYLEQEINQDTSESNDNLPLIYLLNPKLISLCYSAWSLSWLGYADQARTRSQQAIALARQLGQPFNLAHTLAVAGLGVNVTLRDWTAVQAYVEENASLLVVQSFPHWLACCTTVQGRLLLEQGQVEPGIGQIQQGLAIFSEVSTNIARTFHLSLLIESYYESGAIKAGLEVISQAFDYIEQTDERFYEAELHRLAGELLLQTEKPLEEEAAARFEQAIAVAQQQAARLWELRATVSLARLWRRQGQTGAARQRLATIYHWFTEGLDTTDLKEARALLDQLV